MKGNYTEQVTEEDERHLITVGEFRDDVEERWLTDYDGYGYAVKDMKKDKSFLVHPSSVERIPEDATHILWLNR